ncbi:MAG: hypothetical protein E6J90_43010 [Deltaproteobacteria bacterium]|nr:MAG: hypothetical protein E6J90_43010 [Deltaproteobacteria bacterium]
MGLGIDIQRHLRAVAVGERDHALLAILEGRVAEIAQGLGAPGRSEQQRHRIAAQRGLGSRHRRGAHRRHHVGQHGDREALVALEHGARRRPESAGGRGDRLGGAATPGEVDHRCHGDGARGVLRPRLEALALVVGGSGSGALDVLDRLQRIEAAVRRDRGIERLARRGERSLAGCRGLGRGLARRHRCERGNENHHGST